MTGTVLCPHCDGLLGDGDRVFYGHCARCHHRAQARTARCWCGRRVGPNRIDCPEHDDPIPDASRAPSQPTTPGGVFDRRYP